MAMQDEPVTRQKALMEQVFSLIGENRFTDAIDILHEIQDLGGELGEKARLIISYLQDSSARNLQAMRGGPDTERSMGFIVQRGVRAGNGGPSMPSPGGEREAPKRARVRTKKVSKKKGAGKPRAKDAGTPLAPTRRGHAYTKRVLRGGRPGTVRIAPEIVARDEVRRTPHIDIIPEPPIQPDGSFEVVVYADTRDARTSEESEEIVIEFPAGMDSLPVSVQVAPTRHFAVEGDEIKQIVIVRGEERSSSVTFKLRTRDLNSLKALNESPFVTAYFTYAGRSSGMVRRAVRVTGVATANAKKTESVRRQLKTSGALAVHATAARPDLTIEILDPGNEAQHLTCTVYSPHLPAFADGKTAPWNLRRTTGELVAGYFDKFTSEPPSPQQTLFLLRGAGLELFDAAPNVFKEAFWALVDQKLPLRSIYIITQEPHIPWELMIPNRARKNAKREEREDALGVEFLVGRWIKDDFVSPKQRIPLSKGIGIAPVYPGNKRLQHSVEEIKYVNDRFTIEMIKPATVAAIDRHLGKSAASFLHFACHGGANPGADAGAGDMEIQLDGGKELLDATTLRGMKGAKKACEAENPLVFMNACEVGRQHIALSGVGGLAPTFLLMGASAVLAPLWSVKDSIAFEVAQAFYESSKKSPAVPFAEIIRDLRRKAYAEPWEDSWAAYSFYGDPLAAQADA